MTRIAAHAHTADVSGAARELLQSVGEDGAMMALRALEVPSPSAVDLVLRRMALCRVLCVWCAGPPCPSGISSPPHSTRDEIAAAC